MHGRFFRGGQLVFIPSGETNIFWKELGNQPTNKQNKKKTSWHWNSCKKKREFIYSATAPFCLIHLNILKKKERNTQNIKKENDIWWKCDIIWTIVDLLLVLFCVVSRGNRLIFWMERGWHPILNLYTQRGVTRPTRQHIGTMCVILWPRHKLELNYNFQLGNV
jgi:hypothetical protein